MLSSYVKTLGAYYLTLAIVASASLVPELRVWGVAWWGYLPIGASLATLSVALLVPALMALLATRGQAPRGRIGNVAWLWTASGMVVTFACLFVVLRARTHFLGDGYLLLSRLVSGSVPIRPWNAGTYFVQDNLFSILSWPDEIGALLTFQLISYSSGVLLLVASSLCAVRLFEEMFDRFLFVMGMATAGYALLFFGYVENYPLFVLAVGVFCLIGLLVARGQMARWYIFPPFVFAGLFHPFAAGLLPSAVYLLLRNTAITNWWSRTRAAGRVAISLTVGVMVIVVVYYCYDRYYFLRFALVPLVHNQFTVEGYTLLSGKHVVDFMNLLLLLVPGLLLVAVFVTELQIKVLFRRTDYRYLLLALIPCGLISFLIDPKLGMPRDWDVFAFAGVPLAIFSLYLLFDNRERLKNYRSTAVCILVLNLSLLAPRVYTQIEVRTSLSLFDNFAKLDKIRNRSGRFVLLQYLRSRGLNDEALARQIRYTDELPQDSWSETARYLLREGHMTAAIALFHRIIEYDPSYFTGWSDIGVALLKQKQYDSAMAYLKIADGMNPFNPGVYDNLGISHHATGSTEEAERLWRQSMHLDPARLEPCILLLALYRDENRTEDYYRLLSRVSTLENAPLDLLEEHRRYQLLQGK